MIFTDYSTFDKCIINRKYVNNDSDSRDEQIEKMLSSSPPLHTSILMPYDMDDSYSEQASMNSQEKIIEVNSKESISEVLKLDNEKSIELNKKFNPKEMFQ